MCRLVSVTFIVIPSSSSSSAIVERRFSNFPRSSLCFSSFLECFFFLKRLNVPMATQNSYSYSLCYLDVFGLFFIFSFSWLILCSLTCFQIPVLFTSSVMLIAEKGMFMTLPLAKGIFMLPVCSVWWSAVSFSA